MAKQKMLVSVTEDETRIALVQDDNLIDLHIEQVDRERTAGNIYRGTVVKVNPAFQAAFVDYGESRNGFLSINDVNFSLFKQQGGNGGRPKIQHLLKAGQPVMVQVLKEGLRNKGSTLSTFVSLPGRFLVLAPHSDRTGVSRKIEDAETRSRLKEILSALQQEDQHGLIIRTAGIDRPATDLKRDYATLRKEWKTIESKFNSMKNPGLLYQEPGSMLRVLRDYFTDDVEEVWVDSAEAYQEAQQYFKTTLPKFQKRLKLYVGDQSLFSVHGIEDKIESLDSDRVPLKSGGSLVMESTEALVSVDVNSGRSNQETGIEETALRTNMEAADEVARQLRLRNLGGLVVVDFIDMDQAKNRKKVETAMRDALKHDKARTTVGTISQFGLLELSRQRIDMEHSRGLRIKCANCSGTGTVPTANAAANNTLRKIREMAATGKYREIHGELALEYANQLLNRKREVLRDLELEFDVAIHITANPEMPAASPIVLEGERTDGSTEEEPQAPQREAREGQGRRRGRRRSSGDQQPAAMNQADRPEALVDLRDDLPGEAPESLDEPDDTADEAVEATDATEGDATEAGSDRGSEERSGRGGRRRRGRGRGRGQTDTESADRQEEAPAPAPVAAADVDEADEAMEPGRRIGGGTPKEAFFNSVHIVKDPEALLRVPAAVMRTSPLDTAASRAKVGDLLFQSHHVGNGATAQPAEEAQPTAAPEATADGQTEAEEAKPARKRRSRRGRGKSAAAKSTDEAATDANGPAQPEAAAAPAAEPDDNIGNRIEDDEPDDDNIGNRKDAEGPNGNRSGSSNRRRSRRRRPRSGGSGQGGNQSGDNSQVSST